MSVTVKYSGRAGNQLFMYAAARLFAELNDLALDACQPEQMLLETTPEKSGRVFKSPEIVIGDTYDLRRTDAANARYIFDGYFQRAFFYQKHKERVKGFFKATHVTPNTEDIVMHVRLTDYRVWPVGGRVIHPSWYLDILKHESFGKLYIVTDEVDPKYSAHFDKYSPTIVSVNPRSDFDFLRTFERVLMSNSTFAWWSVFMGNAKKIYTFKPWVMDPSNRLSLTTGFDGAIEVDGEFLKGGYIA